jgi:uncharacterized protein YggU (UPF0235/DUF167 family)
MGVAYHSGDVEVMFMPKSRGVQFRNPKSGSALAVEVHFGAQEDHIAQITGEGTLQVALRAASGWAEGNLVLIRLLATVLNVRPSQLEIVAGENDARKLIAVIGLEPQAMEERLRKTLKPSGRG